MKLRLSTLATVSLALAVGLALSLAFLANTDRWLELDGTQTPDEVASSLARWAAQRAEAYEVQGLRIGMLHQGRAFWGASYGTADGAGLDAITENTVFNIGSISKPISMWGVLRLLHDRGIDLDEPVQPYLTRWQIPAGEFNPAGVTFRGLLEHTAGLSLHGYGGFEPELDLPTDVAESLAGATNGSGDVRLISEPGTERRYSGGGYTLLQLLVEELSGLPFAAYMEQAVFEPLGMSASGFEPSRSPHGSQMFAYHGSRLAEHRFVALAAAGLYTSGRDIESFLEANLTSNPVLTPEQLALTFAPTSVDERFAMGYTRTAFDKGTIIGHGGNNTGWNAQIYLVPETGDGFYFLANSVSGAQLEWDLSCAWKSWLQGEPIAQVCTEAWDMTRWLQRCTLALIWILVGSVAWLAHSLWTGRRTLAAKPYGRSKWRLVLRMSCFGLLLVISLAAAVTLYDDFLYSRQGVVLIDEMPVEELDWATNIAFVSLLVWTAFAYSSPAREDLRRLDTAPRSTPL